MQRIYRYGITTLLKEDSKNNGSVEIRDYFSIKPRRMLILIFQYHRLKLLHLSKANKAFCVDEIVIPPFVS